MLRLSRLGLALALLSLAVPAFAAAQPEDPPPALPPGHPPTSPGGAGEGPGEGHAGAPHAGSPHGGGMQNAFAPPQVAEARPSSAVPAGSIRVLVTDEGGQPVANAALDLGRLDQDQSRARTPALTDRGGSHTFSDLPTGSGQAYRVNLRYQGATYSSTPFQLPTGNGYEVRIRRLPVTREDRRVLLGMGRAIFELHDERLRVIHHADLINVGQETYVFPEQGLRIALPEGFLAFQSQRVMGDQQVEEVAGEGLKLSGSLPPGRVTLAWAYDLPLDGDHLEVQVPVPFRTVTYQVIFSRPPPGLRVEVEGMPALEEGDNGGTPVLYTQIQRRPGDPAFEGTVVRISGIPGPGPQRWIATILASLFLLGGLVLGLGGGKKGSDGGARQRRKEALLAEAAELEALVAEGEVGPGYAARRRKALERDLAMILLEEENAAPPATAAGAAPKKKAGARRPRARA